jgi:pimeloyl-ACP methyl ester carboxylesterase
MPPREDHAAISQVIADGMEALFGGDSPIDVAGFSYGGVVAANLSALYPDLIRRLILIGTGGLDTPMGRIELTRVRGLAPDARRAAIRHNLLALMLHDADSVDDLALYLQEINSLRGRMHVGPLIVPNKLITVLPQVRSTIDAIWGEFDRAHPNPSVQEHVLRQVQKDIEFRIITNAGHWAMYEKCAEFNSTLLEILAMPCRNRHLCKPP